MTTSWSYYRLTLFSLAGYGENWRRLAGMDFKWPHRVFADPFDPEYIYVTTFGGSVWRGRAVGSSPDEVPWELGG